MAPIFGETTIQDKRLYHNAIVSQSDGYCQTVDQRSREPKIQGAREPGSQGAREPGSQGAREPGSQGAREPESQGDRAIEPEKKQYI